MKETVNNNALPDLICLSHLRWNFVWQRPQHLLSRFAARQRVFFVEEPIVADDPLPRLDIQKHEATGVRVVVPIVPQKLWDAGEGEPVLHELFDRLFIDQNIGEFFFWYYTPMAFEWTKHKTPLAVVYDCMDELAAFKNAPPQLLEREREIFKTADLVFTGGQSIFEAKREKHEQVFCFPSSIETEHFAQAREISEEPEDQKEIAQPRFGYIGVIDERLDLDLIGKLAALRPRWQIVMIGPVVKISEDDLPRAANIHYLGGKKYEELPGYIAGWDVALMPFALNESTRFISPTKTPEYLAAGAPVVSTPIRDVVRPYGEMGLVHIAETPEGFVQSCEEAMKDDRGERLTKVDAFLSQNSWNKTFGQMAQLIDEKIDARRRAQNSMTQVAAASGAATNEEFSENVVEKVTPSHGRLS
jgi:glycosyltransferase involved in cell wall biosynthesis